MFRYSYTLTAALVIGMCLNSLSFAITPMALEQYRTGVSQEQAGNLPAAETAYRTSMGLDPYDSLTPIRLAMLVERQGRLDEAYKLYEQAAALNPDDKALTLNLARLDGIKQQPEAALKKFTAFMTATNDRMPSLLAIMAKLAKQTHETQTAETLYTDYLKAYPTSTEARQALATLQGKPMAKPSNTVLTAVKTTSTAGAAASVTPIDLKPAAQTSPTLPPLPTQLPSRFKLTPLEMP